LLASLKELGRRISLSKNKRKIRMREIIEILQEIFRVYLIILAIA
jgi:hypothetical protein